MSLRADRYRAKAADCEQAARKLSDANTRTLYLDLAHQGRNLARQAEMLEREQGEE
jgi:hypothetical protein